MQKHYAIVGRGGGNKRVITASLNDLPSDSYFHVLWTGEPTTAEEIVYDWLIDNEKPFTIYGTHVPKGLARHAEDVSDLPMYMAAKDEGCQTALVLWEEGSDDIVISASSIFPKMLELTNGLTPIEVDDDEEERHAEPSPVASDTESPEFFTRSELENMPAAAVKRQAKEKGLDITGKVKAEIIDMLLGEGVDETPATSDSTSNPSDLDKVISQIKIIDQQMRRLNEERHSLLKEFGRLVGYEDIIL